MNVLLAAHAPLAVDLNAPGGYLNWSIFTISEANLVLVAVMVVIFGIALLAPFPGRRHGAVTAAPDPADPAESAGAPDLAGRGGKWRRGRRPDVDGPDTPLGAQGTAAAEVAA